MGKKHDKKKAAEREAEIRRAEKKALKRSDETLAAEPPVAKKGKKKAKVKGAAVETAEAVHLAGPVPEDEKAAAQATADAVNAALDAEIKARLQAKRTARGDVPPAVAESMEQLNSLAESVAADREKRHGEKPAPEDAASTEAEAAAPTAPLEDFAKPSEAPQADFAVNGNGQYLVQRPSDKKLVGYTRVTTYIDALEDKTMLTKWKMRMLLEGVAAAETPDEDGKLDPVTSTIRELVHRRDVAIAKARKHDQKGKLAPGQLAVIVDGAMSDFKKAMDKLADELFELGGGRVAATKGTDLHALAELHDLEGMGAVEAKLDAGEITPSDFADIEAYAKALRAIGAKVTAVEQVIVNDELKVAGRLDRVLLVKLPEIRNAKGEVVYPGDTRARRYVGDMKTGRIDLGAGKIAQQLRLYAESSAYDLDTHERTSHGANRSHGLVFHLPPGSGVCTVHIVDLATGAEGNKLAGQVRAFRSAGRRAIDPKTDVAAIAAPSEETE